MRGVYHFSLSSHQEVMYRDESDLNHGFNCLAEACLETDSSLLAEGFLSTHHHAMVFTDNVKDLLRIERYAYTRYFNSRYGRKGRLGERKPFILTIEGVHHLTVALNYVLRQGLHHGIAATPFGYPHCSANAFFRKDLGKMTTETLMPTAQRYKYLPDRSCIPSYIRMNASGSLLREDVIDTSYVENIYVSPRNFLFQMNRISDQKWIDEQITDNTKTPVITLDLIESCVHDMDISQFLKNEQGRIDTSRLTDLELCKIIDNDYLSGMFSKYGQTIYCLSSSCRADLGNRLWKDIPLVYKKKVAKTQLQRCLCL